MVTLRVNIPVLINGDDAGEIMQNVLLCSVMCKKLIKIEYVIFHPSSACGNKVQDFVVCQSNAATRMMKYFTKSKSFSFPLLGQ